MNLLESLVLHPGQNQDNRPHLTSDRRFKCDDDTDMIEPISRQAWDNERVWQMLVKLISLGTKTPQRRKSMGKFFQEDSCGALEACQEHSRRSVCISKKQKPSKDRPVDRRGAVRHTSTIQNSASQ